MAMVAANNEVEMTEIQIEGGGGSGGGDRGGGAARGNNRAGVSVGVTVGVIGFLTTVVIGLLVVVIVLAVRGPITTPAVEAAPQCPFPTFPSTTLGNTQYVCPDEKLTLDQRRDLLESMKPWNSINGVVLEDIQPASGAKTAFIGSGVERPAPYGKVRSRLITE